MTTTKTNFLMFFILGAASAAGAVAADTVSPTPPHFSTASTPNSASTPDTTPSTTPSTSGPTCVDAQVCPIATLLSAFFGVIMIPCCLYYFGYTGSTGGNTGKKPRGGAKAAGYKSMEEKPDKSSCCKDVRSCGMGGHPVCYLVVCVVLEAAFAAAACYFCLLICGEKTN